MFALILIASINSSSPFSDIKLAIVLHQKAFPDDISFTNWASFSVTLAEPKKDRKQKQKEMERNEKKRREEKRKGREKKETKRKEEKRRESRGEKRKKEEIKYVDIKFQSN
jgi:hypothetical protein